ncbi:hypothetical protein APTSU1_000756700 [Apodemus speciosus]|uniref:Uncharacterized protein n=1 Tax=Apodemus speciosus TaxID=105296 RepID=A0ABQ0EZU3_APOSI
MASLVTKTGWEADRLQQDKIGPGLRSKDKDVDTLPCDDDNDDDDDTSNNNLQLPRGVHAVLE